MRCNRDCFSCPYDDCIKDALELEDCRALAEMDTEILFVKTPQQKKIAAQQKAYYEANREKIAAQQKAYYEANREKYNAYMREYMRAYRGRRREESANEK